MSETQNEWTKRSRGLLFSMGRDGAVVFGCLPHSIMLKDEDDVGYEISTLWPWSIVDCL